MPRKRMIDPVIWTDDRFLCLSAMARLTFIGLITQADDEGRLTIDPRSIKAKIFPIDEFSTKDVANWLNELISLELIEAYKVNGRFFAELAGWRKTQFIQKKKPSNLPSISDSTELLEEIPATTLTQYTHNANTVPVQYQYSTSTIQVPNRQNTRTVTVSTNTIQNKTIQNKTKQENKRVVFSNKKSKKSNKTAVHLIWDHFLECTDRNPKKCRLTAKRTTTIKKLISRFGFKDTRRIITLVAKSSFHAGKNDRNKRYDNLESAPLRDPDKCESWLTEAAEEEEDTCTLPTPTELEEQRTAAAQCRHGLIYKIPDGSDPSIAAKILENQAAILADTSLRESVGNEDVVQAVKEAIAEQAIGEHGQKREVQQGALEDHSWVRADEVF